MGFVINYDKNALTIPDKNALTIHPDLEQKILDPGGNFDRGGGVGP